MTEEPVPAKEVFSTIDICSRLLIFGFLGKKKKNKIGQNEKERGNFVFR